MYRYDFKIGNNKKNGMKNKEKNVTDLNVFKMEK